LAWNAQLRYYLPKRVELRAFEGSNTMRKWICIAALTAIGASVGGYWYANHETAPREIEPVRPIVWRNSITIPRDDGDAEASEMIEPLIVDRGSAVAAPGMPIVMDQSAPRVQWTREITQPQRPDHEPGRVLRMPYAE
jgi:hypothetical protein